MDEEVESVVDKLQQLRLQYGDLMKVSKEQWEDMGKKLGVVKAFLKDSSTKSYYSKTYQELALHIRNCLWDMDDIIDYCRTQVANFTFLNFFFKPPINLLPLAQILDPVIDQIQTYKNVIGDFSTKQLVQRRRSLEKPPPLISERKQVIGLEEETRTVISYLTEETEELDVIPIVGMPGIGKTTLAWKTFISAEAMKEFPTRIWINVSDEFDEKEVFLAISKHFTEHNEDIGQTKLELVASHLQREKFLFVMDDVCSADDWDRLQFALPHSSMKGKGKVLITSCNENVVRHANRTRLPLKVDFLTRDESWSLLRSEVFGEHKCPPELEYIGQVIVDQCCGLPLEIMCIARTLLEEDLSSSNMKERRIAWTKVSSRVPQYRSNILYRSLPNQTRLCFLYFGMFPEGYDIPVWKLISMWIAEGFIQKRGSMSLEETAETYLEDLISRNLVIIGRINSSGKTKTCCIHPMHHEFCRIEAGNQRENLLQQIEFSDGDFHPPISDLSSYHRLSISSNIVLDFLSSKPPLPHVRSFVCFIDRFPQLYNSAIPAGFKRLRVLDVMPIRLAKITSDMYELVHLKFLALSFLDLKILPAEFSKLCNLQTLIIDTTSPTLEVRANIWQFTQLKHLKTNASATLVTTGSRGRHNQKLQTLAMVSPESCTKELCFTACNLKKLGIRGNLSSFFGGCIEGLLFLIDLENLKLVNDVYPLQASSGQLHSLPSPYMFPPKLRSLTLAQTFLDWSQMRTLGRLENLKVLKLKNKAFVGKYWITEDYGFNDLQVLHIDDTDLLHWEASSHHFPRLTSVELHNCEDLRKIPIQLAYIPSLQCLELRDTNLAAKSAIMIRDIKHVRYQKGPRRNHKEFELSIYPQLSDDLENCEVASCHSDDVAEESRKMHAWESSQLLSYIR